MSHEPPGYGRTKMLGEVSHSLAQRALTELKLLQWAFSALPGSDEVDLDQLGKRALEDWRGRLPSENPTAMADDIRDALDRMRGQRGD